MLFIFKTQVLVRANSRAEAEQKIKEEMGLDVYESRFICEEMEDKGQEVEVDLTGE